MLEKTPLGHCGKARVKTDGFFLQRSELATGSGLRPQFPTHRRDDEPERRDLDDRTAPKGAPRSRM